MEVSVQCGAFHGRFPAAFLTGELESFHAQLISLYQTLLGTAKFQTLEGQLELQATGDGLGHVRISGEALDQAGIGNKLVFEIVIDQTQLQTSVQMLAAAMLAFPVRT
ncbi:WapI family immunity protein [Rhodanobacter sp. BL-MT-08]